MADHPSINVALYAQTDVGMVRSGNEDNFLILDLSTGTSWSAGEEEPNELLTFQQGWYGTLLAVSDGMGGALAGEVASRLAVETVRDRMLQLQAHTEYRKLPFHERLRLAIEEANVLIHADGSSNPSHKGLGATFTAVATAGNKAYFAQVGDSRAYLIREGKVARITKDQSLVQQLIDAGQITEEEAETHSYRNVILQALGAHTVINVEVNTLTLSHLDTLLLCSDGLSGKMHADEIATIVNQAGDFKTACQNLIALANQRGGEDNITVVIAQFSGAGLIQPNGDAIDPQGIARSPDTPSELNWSSGVSTDQLTDPVGEPSDEGATEPLPADVSATVAAGPASLATPAPPPATTSPLRPRTGQLKNTNDLSDRVGPVTAVFEIGDLKDFPPSAAAPPAQPPAQPLDGRTEELPGNNSSSPKTKAAAAARNVHAEQKSFSFLPVILTIIALAGIGVVLYWSFNQQKLARTAAEEKKHQKSVKLQEEITRLNDQITTLDHRLQQVTRAESEKRRLQERLDKAKGKLDEIRQIPFEQLKKIEDECEDLAKKLNELEKDLDHQQGLLPGQHLNREPVKV
jgi:PPM family protein phosphatase